MSARVLAQFLSIYSPKVAVIRNVTHVLHNNYKFMADPNFCKQH
jgi:isoprenylcysteine carboxyl methyltransferase (ICMT) family protein YpbQ